MSNRVRALVLLVSGALLAAGCGPEATAPTSPETQRLEAKSAAGPAGQSSIVLNASDFSAMNPPATYQETCSWNVDGTTVVTWWGKDYCESEFDISPWLEYTADLTKGTWEVHVRAINFGDLGDPPTYTEFLLQAEVDGQTDTIHVPASDTEIGSGCLAFDVADAGPQTLRLAWLNDWASGDDGNGGPLLDANIRLEDITFEAVKGKTACGAATTKATRPVVTVNPNGQGGGEGLTRTIGEALDLVAPGGRVQVLPGTYAEDLTIDKGVTLKAIGDGPVILAPTSEDAIAAIRVTTTQPVVLDGITVNCDCPVSATQDGAIAGIGPVDLTLTGVTVLRAGSGVYAENDAASGGGRARVVVRDSRFDGGAATTMEIAAFAVTDMDLRFVHNVVRRTSFSCVQVQGKANADIIGNDLDECGPSGAVRAPVNRGTVVNIVGNRIRNSTHLRTSGGIVQHVLAGDPALPPPTGCIENNSVVDYIGADAPAGAAAIIVNDAAPRVRYNDIVGNAQAGLRVGNPSVIDARHDWWGASDGPSGDAHGSGDAVFGNALVTPFATQPVADLSATGCQPPEKMPVEPPAEPVTPTWFQNPANGHVYRLSSSLPWTDAEAEAQQWHGHLATLDDGAEEAWVRTTFGIDEHYWIGFNDIAQEGTWVWAGGDPVSYTNWAPGEPNNCGGTTPGTCEPENAAIMNWCRNGGDPCFGDVWNDVSIEDPRLGVVEADTLFLKGGWDSFDEPLTRGGVTWSQPVPGELDVTYELRGAEPNHQYQVGIHGYPRADNPDWQDFGSEGWEDDQRSDAVVCREGFCTPLNAWEFGFLTTDVNGDGTAHFALHPRAGSYNVQFDVRMGTCTQDNHDGCGVVFESGGPFGTAVELIVP